MPHMRPVVAALGLVLLAGCGGGSSHASTTSTSATSSSTSTSTSTSAPSSTTSASVRNGASTPELAAEGLYDRWVAADQAGATAYATDDIITELFSKPGGGAAWTFQGCEGVAGGAYCSFSYEGGSVQMHLLNESVLGDPSVTGYKVDSMTYTAD